MELIFTDGSLFLKIFQKYTFLPSSVANILLNNKVVASGKNLL